MPRYLFSLDRASDGLRRSGVVNCDSFAEALDAIGDEVDVVTGDTLEIGVNGFPPAHYQVAWSGDGNAIWQPATSKLAA